MKKLFLIFILLCSTKLFAQAPQGINYQAVAMGTAGVLANHTISLRLSVIDSVATGIAVYTETQNTTTDAVGLFSIVIGNGTPTVGTFNGINWGKNFKFLKTEIDTTGGTSYVLMGITQFMSTPYALYANKTKQTFSDITHPDDYVNPSLVIIDTNFYTVPVGKNLYCWTTGRMLVYGSASQDSVYTGVFSAGQQLRYIADTLPCWLFDKKVDWITFDIITNSLTPPNGKSFVIVNCTPNPYGFYNSINNSYNYPSFYLNGQKITATLLSGSIVGVTSNNVFIVPSGMTLSATLGSSPGQMIINGYFIDN